MKNIIVDIMSHPKISVIVPVYNVEEFLKTCLDSVCNQTFEDIEIICINDGSILGWNMHLGIMYTSLIQMII